MTGFEFSKLAREDILHLLAYSHRRFGPQAADAYEALLLRGFSTIRSDPAAKGVTALVGYSDSFRYHLRSVPQAKPKMVARPRHLVIFTVSSAGVTVLRVLHEKMEMERHLR